MFLIERLRVAEEGVDHDEDARRNVLESNEHASRRCQEEERGLEVSFRDRWRWTRIRRKQDERRRQGEHVQEGYVQGTPAGRHGQSKREAGRDALAS